MSTQATLPDPQAAYNHLFQTVHARAFFGKLAAAGIAPRNEKEAQDLLGLASKLRVVVQEPAVKQAADNNPFAQASAALDKVLADNGLDTQLKTAAAQDRNLAIAQASGQLMQDPAIYNSVLALKAAEAAEVAQLMSAQPQA